MYSAARTTSQNETTISTFLSAALFIILSLVVFQQQTCPQQEQAILIRAIITESVSAHTNTALPNVKA